MKIHPTTVAALATLYLPTATLAQECVNYGFTLEFDGTCTPETVLEAYEDQVFNAAGGTSSTCAESAQADLEQKIGGSLQDLCDQVYSTQDRVAFTEAANRGDDLHFERMFYNGHTDWQEEVQTIYEDENNRPTSILKEDAEAVRTFYQGTAQGRRVSWPGELPNFQTSGDTTNIGDLATCTTNAAMCCWPKDRQANDGNGNCASPYDEDCVDKDVADNTNLCYVDVDRGSESTGFDSEGGYIGFPEDNNNGEGAIHCHGLAWSDDVNDATARYKANNLFFVSMYDHMYQRGYVKNIPGAPMCGCVEQMPTVSRSDCTQVDLKETIKIDYDGTSFTTQITHVDVTFNACRGINNRNNDLWAYMARLYYQGDISPEQFGKAGRIITNTGCSQAERLHLNEQSLTRGYDHDVSTWTKVAGRDDFHDGHQWGKEAFTNAFFEDTLTAPDDLNVASFVDPVTLEGKTPIIHRICASCTRHHKNIYYRRLTPVSSLNILHAILYRRDNGNGENVWNEDFTLHSTYEDAKSGANPWKCPNNAFNYGAAFYGECSPEGNRVRDQYSIWDWYPGPRSDVAYYINKPEDSGVQELDLASGQSRFIGGSHTDLDIGNVGIEGRTLDNDGIFHISASGNDIWNYADQFRYFSDVASGDIDVKVHLSAFTGIVNGYAKAGIMLRSDNSDDATNVFAQMSGSNGVTLTFRSSKGNKSYQLGGWYKTSPVQKSSWLRLVKKMNEIEMYRSEDGIDWTLHGTATVLFPDDTFRVGLAVTSHDNRYVSEATFEDYEVQEYNSPTSAPSLSAAPTNWDSDVEIGGSRMGSFSTNTDNGISYARGFGSGLWGTSDSFFFHNQQKNGIDGGFDVVVYTDRFHTGYMEAMGGIMIRDTNDPDSAFAFFGMRGYYIGASFISRASTGSSTVHHKTDYVVNHKAWLKLSKAAGSGTITAYYKILETDDWIEIGSTEVAFTANSLQVGIAVTSGEQDYNRYADLQTKGFEIVDAPASARKLLPELQARDFDIVDASANKLLRA